MTHSPKRLAILGGGISGLMAARAALARGLEVSLYDPRGLAAAASGNVAGLVTARLDAGGGPVARLYAQLLAYAVGVYRHDTPQAMINEGAVQLEQTPKDGPRFDKLVEQQPFGAGGLERLSPREASKRLRCEVEQGGLWMRDALSINPAKAITDLAARLQIPCHPHEVFGLRVLPEGRIELLAADQSVIEAVDHVILALGHDPRALLAATAPHETPITPVRGQVTLSNIRTKLDAPVAWGGYAVPFEGGLLFGATHDRDETSEAIKAPDHKRNLIELSKVFPDMADFAARTTLSGRARVRATTRDRLPLAGRVAQSVSVLMGMGSRGLVSAPLLAEHVVAEALGLSSPLEADLVALIDPLRASAQPKA